MPRRRPGGAGFHPSRQPEDAPGEPGARRFAPGPDRSVRAGRCRPWPRRLDRLPENHGGPRSQSLDGRLRRGGSATRPGRRPGAVPPGSAHRCAAAGAAGRPGATVGWWFDTGLAGSPAGRG